MIVTYEKAVQAIINAGRRLDALQLAPATSGNYSVRTGDNEMAITVSGYHKGHPRDLTICAIRVTLILSSSVLYGKLVPTTCTRHW